MQPIRVGIGGWTFAPWRGTFYPPGLPHAQELAYASQNLTAIEVNGTFYGSQKPESFRSWRDQTPENFVFALKGPRFTTHRRDLTDASQSVQRFLATGVTALGDKLGPLLWQFPPTRAFDPVALRPFLEALPERHDGRALRHVIEARHASFADPAWITLLREFGVANAIVESDKHSLSADVTGSFLYARLERNAADATEGYDSPALDQWAARFRLWAAGKTVKDLPRLGPAARARAVECFVFFISGEKVAAPRAARAMLDRLRAA
jgi:uncharacterized protein YecE (DUF72 family)